MSRLRLEMSVKANVVSANSGTATISCIKVRVKPIEPAPIMAIFKVMFSSPHEGWLMSTYITYAHYPSPALGTSLHLRRCNTSHPNAPREQPLTHTAHH